MKKQKFYVVVMRRPIGIDKYYRKNEQDATSVLRMLEDLYPKAKFEYFEEEIEVTNEK